jgi:nucleotide-binding universal stress UspA family protein
VDLGALLKSLAGTAVFLLLSFTIGRRIVFRLIRWANDSFVSELPVITVILVVTGVMALITNTIGVHTVLGAFVAGILVGQSPILTRHIDEQLRGLIVALFMPVFFGLAGLTTNVGALAHSNLLLLTIGLIAIASIGKFGGAFLGGRLGGMTWAEALAVGCSMNARGSTEVIFASIGLSMGVLNQDLFTAIVTMAVVTTMLMPPMLRWALMRVPMRPDEAARLEREELEARGFVSRIERLLVAVDASPSGQLALRLAGLLAGARRMPTTVIHFDYEAAGSRIERSRQALRTKSMVAESVEASEEADPTKLRTDPIDVATRIEKPTEDAIVAEAKKGYGLLFIGREPASEGSTFHEHITRSVLGLGGPFAIAIARGIDRERTSGARLDILVPISGNPVSRRSAELAVALAHASQGSLTALHITGSRTRPCSWQHRLGAALASASSADAIIPEVVRLGEHYGVAVKGAVRTIGAPQDAILRHLQLSGHNLLVMGVSPRPGDQLFFGEVPAELLERADCSVLFIAGEPPTPVPEAPAPGRDRPR